MTMELKLLVWSVALTVVLAVAKSVPPGRMPWRDHPVGVECSGIGSEDRGVHVRGIHGCEPPVRQRLDTSGGNRPSRLRCNS